MRQSKEVSMLKRKSSPEITGMARVSRNLTKQITQSDTRNNIYMIRSFRQANHNNV